MRKLPSYIHPIENVFIYIGVLQTSLEPESVFFSIAMQWDTVNGGYSGNRNIFSPEFLVETKKSPLP